MDLSSIAGSIPVTHGNPLRVQNSLGRRISVLEGHVWVTQDGDPRDVVLGAGDEFRFDRPAAVVSALDSDARILCEQGADVGGSGRRSLFLAALSRLWTGWRDARRAEAARASLCNLNDYLLADIGLHRAGCGWTRHD